MAKIGIVSDSTSDVPKEYVDKLKIKIVPLSVIFGDQSYLDDGVDITIEKFYEKLKVSDVLPTTAQPSPGDFIKTYRDMLEEYDGILSIHISKKMSGTIASAEMAKKEFPEDKITIIDSELVHMPLGFLAMRAAELALEGAGSKEIVEGVMDLKSKLKVLFVPSTLEYLKKGGRIGRSKALLASLLEIKPILTLNLGEVSPYKNTRRWNQAKTEMINSMDSMLDKPEKMTVSICDSDNKPDRDEMAERIKEKFKPKKMILGDIGGIVGTHLGPGGIGITFYEE